MSGPSQDDSKPQPNERLRAARRRTESPSHPGQCLSRQELGELVSAYVYRHHGATTACDANWVGKLERGEITWPRAAQREAFRAILDAPSDDALGFVNRRGTALQLAPALPLPATDNRVRSTITESPIRWTPDGEVLDSPSQILDRMIQAGPVVTDGYLDGLDSFVLDIVDRYELEGPRQLAPEVRRQRAHVHELLIASPPSRRGLRLMGSAGQLSALLAYMAVNLGQFAAAGAYASEAFHLADEAGDRGLKAWVRGTQSFAAYYRRRYREALDHARDGLRYAGKGIQAVRLTINGEARALAQLHDRQGTEKAIGRAYQLLERYSPDDGMSSCISFGVYSEARVASNAVTALLAAGRINDSLREANRVLDVVDTTDSAWSKALVRLDAATAEAKAEHPDLDRAVAHIRAARRLTRRHPLESVTQRTDTCLDTLQRWRHAEVVAELLNEIESEQ